MAELGHDGQVVLLLWAPWESYHVEMAAELVLFVHEYEGTLFRSLNIDDESFWQELSDWHVLNVPGLVFFRQGKLVEKAIGGRTGDKLVALLRGWLGR